MAATRLVLRRGTGYRVLDFKFESSTRIRTCGCGHAIKSGNSHVVIKVAQGYPLWICNKCCGKMISFLTLGSQNAEKKNKKS